MDMPHLLGDLGGWMPRRRHARLYTTEKCYKIDGPLPLLDQPVLATQLAHQSTAPGPHCIGSNLKPCCSHCPQACCEPWGHNIVTMLMEIGKYGILYGPKMYHRKSRCLHGVLFAMVCLSSRIIIG